MIANNGLLGIIVNKKKVFVPMAVDLIHDGHINILENAYTFGEVIVGLLTDEAIVKYKPLPVLNYQRREKIIKSLKYVKSVIKTLDWDYFRALEKLKPDFVVHGDDWKINNQKQVRINVLKQIKNWGGKLIEIPYTKGISSSQIKQILKKSINPLSLRTQTFSRMLNSKEIIRVLEVHNGISALIAENTKYKNKEFDCMWLSSLTHSTSKGKPDIEYIDDTTVTSTINDIFDCTMKPLIFDADSGGRVEHLKFTISNLERLGVSAMIIEDKIGEKKNSLSKLVKNQKQDTVSNFCKKIQISKESIKSSEMKVFARIESLILGNGLNDALKRAKDYINAGADGIMIHSKSKSPNEVFSFCKKYNNFKNRKPLIVVPSTYDKTSEIDLKKNQLMRSAIPSMQKAAQSILKNGRSFEHRSKMLSISDILELLNQ